MTTKVRSGVLALTVVIGAGGSSVAKAALCPVPGWAEHLASYQQPNAAFPTEDTRNVPHGDDCPFQQWSAEAFVWATAIGTSGLPRFLELPTPDQLLPGAKRPSGPGPALRLAGRSLGALGDAGFAEGAGAIVEADGNMLVGPNGYPVYASVHMNKSYFDTAKANLIATGAYQKQPPDSYFNVGAAVFKATWLRLDANEQAPAGAFTTTARVPVLRVLATKSNITVIPSGQYVTARVALVGLHVVGQTVNHPEFLWATFEHNQNSPRTPDNTFSTSGSNPGNFTLYRAGTSYGLANKAAPPAPIQFSMATQRFSPPTTVVLENATGGSTFGTAPAQDIASVNAQTHTFFNGSKSPTQASFQSYDLIGTVWFDTNTYVLPAALTMDQSNAIGAVNLANSTAETFVQYPNDTNMKKVQNCFLCHNAEQIAGPGQPPLALRRIGISHVLEVGTPYAVPNLLQIPTK